MHNSDAVSIRICTRGLEMISSRIKKTKISHKHHLNITLKLPKHHLDIIINIHICKEYMLRVIYYMISYIISADPSRLGASEWMVHPVPPNSKQPYTLTTPRQRKQRLSQTPRFSDSVNSQILRATKGSSR